MGYIANSGRCFGGKTGRGVLAYRKVNGMARSYRAGKGLVKRAFAGGRLPGPPPGRRRTRRGAALQAGARLRQGRQAVRRLPGLDRASPRRRRSPAISPSPGEPGYNSEGMYYSFYFTAATLCMATNRCPTTRPATAASAPSSPTSPDLRTARLRREHLRLLRGAEPVIGERALRAILVFIAAYHVVTGAGPGRARHLLRPDRSLRDRELPLRRRRRRLPDRLRRRDRDRRGATRLASAAALAGGDLVRIPCDQPCVRHR